MFQGFTIPQELQSLLHWIITDPKHVLDFNCGKKEEIENSIDIFGQVIINSVKTERQITQISNKTFRQVIEMPFTVGLSLHLHKLTRSKELINILSNFHLSISYDKLLRIETLSDVVVKKMESCNVSRYSTWKLTSFRS